MQRGASSSVPDILPGLSALSGPPDNGVDLGNMYSIVYKFVPTGETVTIITIKEFDKKGRVKAAQSSKDNHV